MKENEVQLLNVLVATGKPIGLIINFGTRKVENKTESKGFIISDAQDLKIIQFILLSCLILLFQLVRIGMKQQKGTKYTKDKVYFCTISWLQASEIKQEKP